MSTAAAPGLEAKRPATYWYSISASKYNPETKKLEHGLFVQKVKVVRETEKMITIETGATRPDGSAYSYRTKKTSDNTYWFNGHYPTLEAAKEAYRDFCSERLTALSQQFAQTATQLAEVDSLTDVE